MISFRHLFVLYLLMSEKKEMGFFFISFDKWENANKKDQNQNFSFLPSSCTDWWSVLVVHSWENKRHYSLLIPPRPNTTPPPPPSSLQYQTYYHIVSFNETHHIPIEYKHPLPSPCFVRFGIWGRNWGPF